ncbi:MAG: gliding motility-associated ABC transporter substrate-binding protein GldG, partial [Bacteroidetes bacterium]|nr:gliding motility-associated ABC transporter substrate-binding protein GldG [Bacteroidota bacterium]
MSKRLNDIIGLVLGLVVLVLLNIAGGFLFERLDLTSDKRYSLSEVSEQQATELEDVVFVRV